MLFYCFATLLFCWFFCVCRAQMILILFIDTLFFRIQSFSGGLRCRKVSNSIPFRWFVSQCINMLQRCSFYYLSVCMRTKSQFHRRTTKWLMVFFCYALALEWECMLSQNTKYGGGDKYSLSLSFSFPLWCFLISSYSTIECRCILIANLATLFSIVGNLVFGKSLFSKSAVFCLWRLETFSSFDQSCVFVSIYLNLKILKMAGAEMLQV